MGGGGGGGGIVRLFLMVIFVYFLAAIFDEEVLMFVVSVLLSFISGSPNIVCMACGIGRRILCIVILSSDRISLIRRRSYYSACRAKERLFKGGVYSRATAINFRCR